MIPLMLGFIWIAIDKQKQSFHDKVSGAVVVRDLDAYIASLSDEPVLDVEIAQDSIIKD